MSKVLGSSLVKHREYTCITLPQTPPEFMSQRSFDKITLSDVADHAGVGHTVAYDHFADKEDLLLALMGRKIGRYAKEFPQVLVGAQDLIDRLRIYVRQQVLIARHFHFPTSGPPSGAVSCETAGRLKAYETLMAWMPSSILTDTMDQELASVQEPEQAIPFIHAIVMGGRLTPSDLRQWRAYLGSLGALVLQAVGIRQPAHAVPITVQPRAAKPLENARAPGPLRHSAVG